MHVKSSVWTLIEKYESLLKSLAIVLVVFLIVRSCSSTSDSLPYEVHKILNSRYRSCVEVEGSYLRVGDNPQRECTELTTNVLGQGTIPQQNRAEGTTKAICFRVLIEKPYFWAQSHTQYEEITSFTRIASKVAVLHKGEWIVYPDQYVQDSERWAAYACPAKFDITLEEWGKEY